MNEIRDLQPTRRGGDIYVSIAGREVKLSPMQANLIMRAWAEAVGAALVADAHSSVSVTADEAQSKKNPAAKSARG
ncbi:hypothetical protein FHW03_001660 [Ochrobactrum sp. RH2CCR150]|nr:hypothetical protein [Ochrobactrum sp. RH2CCR150]